MASAAGLECSVDPALAAALRNQKTGTKYVIIHTQCKLLTLN